MRDLWRRLQQHGVLTFSVCLMSWTWWACFDSCEPPFAPGNHIDKFRVLAIKVEPPEVQPGARVQVSFLAVTPDGLLSSKETFPASQCLHPDGGVADPSAIWIACLPGVGAKQQSDSSCTDIPLAGTGPADGGNRPTPAPDGGSISRSFQILFPPCGPTSFWVTPKDYLAPLSKTDQETGADALIVLATTYKKQRQISLKRVRISTRPSSSQNTNPTLQGLRIDGQEVSSCQAENKAACKLIIVPANKSFELSATVDPKRRDLLPQKPGEPTKREDIEITWYATGGEFDVSKSVISGAIPPKNSPWPKWYPNDFRGKALKAGQEVQLIAVAKDLRGGIDWLSCRIQLGPAAP